MNSSQPDPRIAKLSSRIQRTYRVFLVLVCAAFLLVIALTAAGFPTTDASWHWGLRDSSDQPIPFDRPADYLVWLPATILMAFLFLAPLYYFDQLLAGYRDGKFFSAEPTRLLRGIGYLLIAQQIAIVFLDPLCWLVLLIISDSGTFVFKVEFNYNQAAVIAISLVIIILARLMGLANEAIEEREFTI